MTGVRIESMRRDAASIELRYPSDAAVIAALRDSVPDDALEVGAACHSFGSTGQCSPTVRGPG